MQRSAFLALSLIFIASCAPKPEALRVSDVLRFADAGEPGAQGHPACSGDNTPCRTTTRVSPDVLFAKLNLPFRQTESGWVASTPHLQIEMADDERVWTLNVTPLQ